MRNRKIVAVHARQVDGSLFIVLYHLLSVSDLCIGDVGAMQVYGSNAQISMFKLWSAEELSESVKYPSLDSADGCSASTVHCL